MGFMEEYYKLKKKRKDETESKSSNNSFMNEYQKLKEENPTMEYSGRTSPAFSVSPTIDTITEKSDSEKEESKENKKWYQSGEFEYGYQFGDIAKTILGAVKKTSDELSNDISPYIHEPSWVGNKVMAGVNAFNKSVTGTADVLIGKPLQELGWKDNPISSANNLYSNMYDSYNQKAEEIAKENGYGVGHEYLGEAIESTVAAVPNAILALMTSGSSLGATTGDLATKAAYESGNLLTKSGLTIEGMMKDPQYWLSFAQTYGSDYEEAKNKGADDVTAAIGSTISSLINAGIEIGFDGASGIQGLPEKVKQGDKNAILEWVKSSIEEGNEEVLQDFVSNIVSKTMYDKDTELANLEDMAKDWSMGATVGAVLGGGQMAVQGAINSTQKAIQTHEDSKLTENEQKVVDKVVKDRIEEAQKKGDVSNKEKAKIRNEVVNELKKGYISTDTIEEVLGGETYKSYRETVDNEDALLKEYEELINLKKNDLTVKQDNRIKELEKQIFEFTNNDSRNKLKEQLGSEVSKMVIGDRLSESYNERIRRSQGFESDLTKYDAKQRKVVQNAIDSGILNNTNKTHEFVDMIAKISADKGVIFDFTNNAKLKESGFAIEGKTINGLVTNDGVALNIQSSKSLNSVVGHEITHVLEGTYLYDELQQTLFEYAKSRKSKDSKFDSEYKERLYNTRNIYKNVNGYEGVEGFKKIKREVVADLVGDYLFTDEDFVNNLSANHRNIFQKIYDEIKYLYKVATAGSEEARELEKVKRAFDKAYREGVKWQTEANADDISAADSKYSISVTDKDTIDFLENQEHITTYKAMQVIDGKLYPPMAAKVKDENGRYQFTNPSKLGVWQQATEDTKNIKKIKNGVGYYTLNKGDGTSIDAAYNPYEHSSNLVLNDQFESAYRRDNLVVVECEIPVSEMSSGYKAQYAKDSTGVMDWKAGVVAGNIKNNKRQVYLSRYLKPVRILSDSEVAAKYKEILNGTGVSVPFNVVQPSLLSELEKAGVAIDYEGSPMYKANQKRKSDKAKADTKYSLSDEARSYRGYSSKSPMSRSGYAMFVDDRNMAYDSESEGRSLYSVSHENLVDVKTLIPKIKDALHDAYENGTLPYELGYLEESQLDEFAELANPDDIIMSAGFWDNEDAVDWLFNNTNIMDGIVGVKTEDGAIAFDESIIENETLKSLSDTRYSLSDSIQTESELNSLKQERTEIEDQIDMAFYNDLSDAEIRKLKNRLYKVNADIDKIVAEERNSSVKTPMQTILDNLGEYRRSDLESLAEQISEGAWDGYEELSRSELEDALREEIQNRNLTPLEMQSSKFGLYVRPVESNRNNSGDVQYSLSDSDGNQLSEAQQEYFKYSKVRDANGNLLKVYHGTPRGGFNEFSHASIGSTSDYGYLGRGFYFTSSERIAKYYAGYLNSSEVKTGYVNITNPYIIPTKRDLAFTLESIMGKRFDGEDADYERSVAFTEWLKDNGYDGVICKNEIMALNSNQFKNADNTNPTDNPDIRFSLSVDTDGRQLTADQIEYFKDSKVVDENGNLKVMYHGTSNGGHTIFEPYGKAKYGLFGLGTYFTDNRSVAESYTQKGKGNNPQVYESYLNIKNPMDMDAAADPAEWAEAFPDAYFPKSGTNEDFYRAMEEYFEDEMLSKWEAAETAMEAIEGMGYDGITHIGGGRFNKADDTRHRVYIAFEPEQIKNIDNTSPTADPDIRYSLNDGKQENDNFMIMDGDSVTKYSLSTWTPETQNNVKKNLIKAGFDSDRVDKWIKDTNSVASIIASDKDRLDFVAADNQTMLKNNQEYVKTLDASTLCAKRLIYQGTFNEIQHRMPDTMLSSDDLIDLLNIMKEHGVQTPCGVCYVESRRRHLGKFAQEWLNGYNGDYKPHLDEVTTSDGLEALRTSHPDTYEDFMTAMKKKGSANPKVVQLRTEYRNEIMSLTPAQIRKIEAIGGLRVQSFSDFETPHLLDMMQAVMDMSAKGLSSQAYTKVPNFAWVFGDTGIKINLSLIADGDGFDSNGNLAFSSVEGMDFNDAMELRNAYPENVGTIIVGANDKHILACMADDRIDFIIPFHRSGWGQNELEMMGMSSYKDYTYGQNEHDLKTGKGVANLYPPDYWDYNLSGKENAERYLNLCAKTGREPKFSNFLVNNGDGSYSLQPDGSTDGYWKTLIDFKMYDNDGNGAPQKKVLPNFNMEEAYRVLNEYEGGANKLPVANDVVEEFVSKYKEKNIAPIHSLSNVGEPQKTYGNYNVYGNDIAIEEAPIRRTAPVRKTVSETKTTGNILPDDYAPPVSEEDFAPVAASEESTVTENASPMEPQITATENVAPTYGSKNGVIEGQQKMWNTKVLTEEPKVQKKKIRAWSKFKANFLDKGSVFEDLSLKTKNRELMGKWNYILSSESRAQRMIGNGSKVDGVKSLNDIRSEVEKTGKTKQFYEYLYHKHNVDRMQLADRYKNTQNKPVFGEAVTAEASQELVDQYESKNPEFKEYAKDVYNYMNHLRKLMVDNGVISQETSDLWDEMYPHYVPIRRAGDTGIDINVPLDSRRTGINAPVKRATGGSRDILPLFDTMAMRTQQTYKAIAKNRFGVELKNTLGTIIANEAANVDEVIDSVDSQDGLLQEGKNGQNPTFTVFENGKKVTFEITDDMYDALKPTSEGLAYTNKIANTVSNLHRGLLTEYNPVFMATNAIKDAQDVLVNSQHPARTYAQMPKAAFELIRKGSWYNEYLDNGGEQNTYFDKDTNTFEKEKSTIRKVVGMPLDVISKLNNGIEMLPRLAEYMASRKAGRSAEVSMLDAARVTTNFAAGGDVTKFLNRNGATFLNASVQGAVQQVRNVREAKANGLKGWVNLAAKFAVAGLPAILLNNLLWDDDDEYDDLSDYVKQNYYVVAKYGDGKFVRIPKGRALAVIQNAFEQISNAATGNDEVDLASFLELAVSNLAPNNPIDNNIISPIIQVSNNKTWYGDDLVPKRLQDLPQAEQFDESTDEISKWMGEKLNYSPYKINYLLNQYSGGIGDVALPMITPESERESNSFTDDLLAPLMDKFTTDSVMKNQNISNFYDTMDKLTTNAKSRNATDEDVLKYKYFNSVNDELSELYAQKREIQNSNLSDDEKYSLVREIQKQIVDITKESLNSYNDVFTSETYAKIADRQYMKTDDGEWKKITDKQLEKQDKVTNGLGISASNYWGNKAECDFAYDNPEKYAVAKSVGGYNAYKAYTNELYDIKADKDSNGKTISGSRKEKVIDYIDNLDADYGEKIILFKSEYPSDDTYNYEIIDYLNSRNDISYEEMETILKELGFTVLSDGSVRW